MRKSFLALIVALLLPFASFAQVADSTSFRLPAKRSDFKATQLIAPGALMAGGALIHFAAHDAIDVPVNNCTSTWKKPFIELTLDDYGRFIPTAMNIVLGLSGVEGEHVFVERLLEGALAYGTFTIIGYGLKAVVDSPRPDGSDNRSFPSGHTCTAFAGAEMVRMEYGWGWGAGAYAVATGVAALRLYNNQHWASDLIFGAGLGIFSAHVGGWLLEPTKKLLGIDQKDLSIAAVVDPVSGAICPTLALRF